MSDTQLKPLTGVKVLDFSALGPGPFATMMLADYGADVLSVSRPGGSAGPDPSKGMRRGKAELEIDLRSEEGRKTALDLALNADVVIESNRPGVMERLGLGPEVMLAENPSLIYARLTGWGQSGPYSGYAGHDINYLAISGLLSLASEDALPPLGTLGDLANGSYQAVSSIVMALFHRDRAGGKGVIIDIAITDGAAYMLQPMFGEIKTGLWDGVRENHILAGNAPFYSTYTCKDGLRFSVGAIESKFYDRFLSVLALDDVSRSPRDQLNSANWPELKQKVAQVFLTRTRDEWSEAFSEADACCTPVLELDELASNEHIMARGLVGEVDNALESFPGLRFLEFGAHKEEALDRSPAAIVGRFTVGLGKE